MQKHKAKALDQQGIKQNLNNHHFTHTKWLNARAHIPAKLSTLVFLKPK